MILQPTLQDPVFAETSQITETATNVAFPPSGETYPASIVAALASGAALRGPTQTLGGLGDTLIQQKHYSDLVPLHPQQHQLLQQHLEQPHQHQHKQPH